MGESMFLRATSGESYVNSENRVGVLLVHDPGSGYQITATDESLSSSSGWVLATGFANQAAALAGRAKLVSVLKKTGRAHTFLSNAAGDRVMSTEAVSALVVTEVGDGTWRVEAHGIHALTATTLASGYASLNAAIAGLDSIAQEAGALDVAELLA